MQEVGDRVGEFGSEVGERHGESKIGKPDEKQLKDLNQDSLYRGP